MIGITPEPLTLTGIQLLCHRLHVLARAEVADHYAVHDRERAVGYRVVGVAGVYLQVLELQRINAGLERTLELTLAVFKSCV